jgi:hypothetical protein
MERGAARRAKGSRSIK